MNGPSNAASSQANSPSQAEDMFRKSPVLNAVLIALAIVGAIAVVGAFGMWAIHVGMMNGVQACQTAMGSPRGM